MSYRSRKQNTQSLYAIASKYTGERNGYIERLEFQQTEEVFSICCSDNLKAKNLYKKILFCQKTWDFDSSREPRLPIGVIYEDDTNKIIITGNLKNSIELLEDQGILAVAFVLNINEHELISQIINKNSPTNNNLPTSVPSNAILSKSEVTNVVGCDKMNSSEFKEFSRQRVSNLSSTFFSQNHKETLAPEKNSGTTYSKRGVEKTTSLDNSEQTNDEQKNAAPGCNSCSIL